MTLTINIEQLFEEENPLSKYNEVTIELLEEFWVDQDVIDLDLNTEMYGDDKELLLSEKLRLQTYFRNNPEFIEDAVNDELDKEKERF